ncbi:f5c33c50-c023-41c7-aad5-53ef6561463f-CDS [Sclerotinia trifoliorum]|uniref:F5c33c50-c023-41c7-aad5-53ef6561463f-CDS n=1 Tax=Sclerotinia trifoliorum TaxID=28548 RepID=A0A8H2ZMJ8_9HELO|nr:f5c33c50-c023-41c7-aad5-53ef6561463f-CDS [Sclerotinia trifoliorum]
MIARRWCGFIRAEMRVNFVSQKLASFLIILINYHHPFKMQFHKLLAVVFGLIPRAVTSSNYSACPDISPGPATIFQLVELYPYLHLQIQLRQKIFVILQLFTLLQLMAITLSRVFAPNARANYSAAIGILYGPGEIANYISTSLASFVGTQHRYGTQYITICSPSSAISVTCS